MQYEEALRYLEQIMWFGSKPGLSRVGRLLALMGDPQKSLRFVHVAGTCGKGSVSAACASILTAAGYKTGLYTSPYVEDFCERIQIDGRMIAHDALASEVEAIRPLVDRVAAEGDQPTEFEVITALAFSCFKKAGCDVVVLEVGLGGRLDATNVIEAPLVSVITTIALDHTEILGDTLSKIACEKCGIIKRGGLTVSSPEQDPEALSVIMETCAHMENTLLIPGLASVKILGEGLHGSEIEYRGARLKIPLCGRHQIANFITACEVADALRSRRGFSLSDEDIARGLALVKLPARVEVLCDDPLVVLDGAHNPAKLGALADIIRRYLPGRRLVAVMGMLKDKDYRASVGLIAPLAQSVVTLTPESTRALAAAETAKVAALSCADVVCMEDYAQAFDCALQKAGGKGAVVICGSFYLAGPMRKIAVEKLREMR